MRTPFGAVSCYAGGVLFRRVGDTMQKAPGILLLFFLFPLVLSGQSPATVDKIKFADTAGAKYYNLINQGLVSFSCNLKVDWDTVPKVLLVPAEIAGRQGLESTRIKVSQDLRSTAKVEHEYPQGTLAPAKVVYDPFLGWLQDVVRGFMMTWSAKGLGGPIPTEGNIDHVTREPTGYRIVLVNPRDPNPRQQGLPRNRYSHVSARR